jgi:hypothetical protein
MLGTTETAGRDLVFGIAIRTDLFASDWATCDRVANYAATLVSHRRVDPLRYANLFSSVLNELLETAFRRHAPDGEIRCNVYRGAPRDCIELTVPSNAAVHDFYSSAVAEACHEDVGDRYVAALFEDRQVDPAIALLELAADYQARMTLEAREPDQLTLTVDLVLDEAGR